MTVPADQRIRQERESIVGDAFSGERAADELDALYPSSRACFQRVKWTIHLQDGKWVRTRTARLLLLVSCKRATHSHFFFITFAGNYVAIRGSDEKIFEEMPLYVRGECTLQVVPLPIQPNLFELLSYPFTVGMQ